MAASMGTLRRQAIKAGVASTDARKAKSEAELNDLISNLGKETTVAVKKAVKKSATKGTAKRGRPAKSTPAAEQPKRRGRPPGSGKKATPVATKTTGKKRGRPPGTGKKTVSKATTNGNGGRHMLSGVDWSETENWNPRAGSPPDVIIRLAKKFKGNREKIFDELKSDVWTFVNKKKLNGQVRDKAEGHTALKYRIAREMWAFAVKTGQHKKSENRAAYGTAGKGAGLYVRGYGGRASHLAPRGKKSAAKKSTNGAKSTGKKRGRPAKAKK